MSQPRSTPFLLALACGLLLLVGLFLLTHRPPATATQPATTPDKQPDSRPEPAAAAVVNSKSDDTLALDASGVELAEKLSAHLNRPGTRAHEAVLIFKDADGYRRFLLRAAQSGVTVVAQIDALNAVRVRVRAYDTFAADLVARAGDYGGIGANTFVSMPPPPDELATGRSVAVGDTLLDTLGVPAGADTSTWGRGVTLAVLDGGAIPDPTLGARLRYLDIGLGYAGTGEAGHHGTAVAALAAGSSADASGVAPAATVLSIRVIGTDGQSDVFTVTQGIVAGVDAGAQIINLSLGGYGTSEVLSRAIAYARSRGVVIVAAAGNDGADRLVWPAADPRVVSVGATDATGRLADFSNSGAQLRLTAPGVGIRTADLNQTRSLFSGTSASAPVVSGALAALMSQTPGLTAAQAVEILQSHANDAGPAGTDPRYGQGTVNLGWALARDDRTRVDNAISSHVYRPGTGTLDILVQNRGGAPAGGLTLTFDLNGLVSTQAVPALAPGRSTTVTLTLDAAARARPIVLRTRLDNPPGVTDAVPANNTRASLIEAGGP
jgi:hypothetical protein